MSHPQTQLYPPLRSRMAIARRSTRVAFMFAVMGLLAWSFLFGLTYTPRALAEERAPDAPGSIAGVIRTPNGEPQAGVPVTLHKLAPNQPNTWSTIRTTVTGADGTYRFALLLVGVYRIGVMDPDRVYAEGYYPAAPTLYQGADIPVAGNQYTDINLTLQPSSQITGLITTTNSISVTNLQVSLVRRLEEYGQNYWQPIQNIFLLGSSGTYSFTGLSATNYRICATGSNLTLAFSECYDNVYDISRATDLKPNVGTTLSNVNIVLGDGADYAQLSGRVVSSNNEPLAGIAVYAMPVPSWPAFPIQSAAPASASSSATQRAASGGYPYFSYPVYSYGAFTAYTDSQGNYHFPQLTAGKYNFYFSDPDGYYAFTYYGNVKLAEEAVIIDIEPKEVITDINVQLARGNRIIGTFTILGQPAANGTVNALLKTASGWRGVGNWPVDTSTGQYEINGLPAGTYTVFAQGYINDGYTAAYYYSGYFGGNSQETAAEIPLTTGETGQANIAVSGNEQFNGSISGRIRAGGTPVAGAKVSIYYREPLCCSYDTLYPLAYVLTDAEGRYRLDGLTNMELRIGVEDPGGIYATTYYTNSITPLLSSIIQVEDGKTTTGVDLDLPLAGAISGRVTLREGDPVADLYVAIYAPALRNPNSGYMSLVSNYTRTDADGRYTIKGLHAGNYHICFTPYPTTYPIECYAMPYFSPYDNTQGRVTVVAGQTTSDIDLIWGPDLMYYLPIIGQ